jgi:hypothetical protein
MTPRSTLRAKRVAKRTETEWGKVDACPHHETIVDVVVGRVCLNCPGLWEPDDEAPNGGRWMLDWRKARR